MKGRTAISSGRSDRRHEGTLQDHVRVCGKGAGSAAAHRRRAGADPGAQRNASQAVNALLSADLALSGAKFPIPTDEVIDAMYKAGRLLPAQLRETAMGGIAATETGKAIADRIFNNSQGCSRP